MADKNETFDYVFTMEVTSSANEKSGRVVFEIPRAHYAQRVALNECMLSLGDALNDIAEGETGQRMPEAAAGLKLARDHLRSKRFGIGGKK